MFFIVKGNSRRGVLYYNEAMEVYGGILERFNPKEVFIDNVIRRESSVLIEMQSLEELVLLKSLTTYDLIIEKETVMVDGERVNVLHIDNDFEDGYSLKDLI